MYKYIEFCFPGDAECRYEIVFGWGIYAVYATGRKDTGAHGKEARYRGYIVARPSRTRDAGGRALWIYLVTPGGEAWRREADERIPVAGKRHRARNRRPVELRAEPVIDDFLAHRETWQHYGTMRAQDYGGYRLERFPPG